MIDSVTAFLIAWVALIGIPLAVGFALTRKPRVNRDTREKGHK